jgi:acetyl esterase/lipase
MTSTPLRIEERQAARSYWQKPQCTDTSVLIPPMNAEPSIFLRLTVSGFTAFLSILAPLRCIAQDPLPQPNSARADRTDRTETGQIEGWPAQVYEARFSSGGDGSLQPTLCYFPKPERPAPLLVALHTWQGNYRQPEPAYATWCIEKGWAFVHPNFRGPNRTPEACGSQLVVEDILSVVEWAKQMGPIDHDRIYLTGCSGGGYASMLLAGRAPHLWAAVSQWCGIYDLRDWHTQRFPDHYAKMLEAACGGAPGSSEAAEQQYRIRSASSWLAAASHIPFDLNTGILDGHTGSVPVSHSLKAFNALARPEDQLPTPLIDEITASARIPETHRFPEADPLYGDRPVLFRRTSGQARISVFEGAHESIVFAGLAWLEQQRRGKPAVWNIPPSTLKAPIDQIGK